MFTRETFSRITLAVLLLPSAAVAQQAGQPSSAVARSVPSAPDSRHVFVLDSAHLLTESGVRALQDSASSLQRTTGADIAFVTLPTLHGGAVEEAALTIGRTWKVGSNGALGDPTRARGVVILYVPDKTSVAGANLRVEVGRGLEGAITDGGGSRQILESMKPGLRAKRYDDGFIAGFVTAAALVRAENAGAPRTTTAPTARHAPTPVDEPDTDMVIVIVVCVIGALFLVFAVVKTQRSAARGSAAIFPDGLSSSDSSSSSNVSLWSGADSGSSASSSSDSGGSFGGGGDYSGGGASDTV